MRLSYLVHAIGGLLLFFGVVFAGYYLWNNYRFMSGLEVGQLLLLVSIAIGINGIMHFYEEIYFNYNPISGDSTILDSPVRQ